MSQSSSSWAACCAHRHNSDRAAGQVFALFIIADAAAEQEAVAFEINRRNQGASLTETALPKTTGTSSQPSMLGNKTNSPEDIPLAKANLIRASFMAGLKPATIARNLRLPQSWVNRILSGTEKPKCKA